MSQSSGGHMPKLKKFDNAPDAEDGYNGHRCGGEQILSFVVCEGSEGTAVV